jgi:nucleoside-diphosphate-sugar epimerase
VQVSAGGPLHPLSSILYPLHLGLTYGLRVGSTVGYHSVMRVLIVGCGYVGQALGAELVRQGHEVFGVRRRWGTETVLEQPAGIKGLAANITHPEQLAALPKEWDWVVNCVSSSKGGLADYRSVYLQGTRNLVEWLLAVPPQKFVYTSSTSVYGQTDGSLVTESSPVEPATETGRVLLQTEEVLLESVRRNAFPAILVRVAGIYGPGRGYWFKQYLSGAAVLEGKGERLLNMIHRDDVVGTVIAALQRGRPGEIYNAVDDEPVTQVGFFRWLSACTSKPLPPFVPEEAAAALKRGLTSKKVSNLRLKSELRYHFKYPTFREGYAAEIAGSREGRLGAL